MFISKNKEKLHQQDFESYFYILKTLDAIVAKLSQDVSPEKNKRYAVLSSLVVELPRYVLDPKLGVKIIDLERKYLEF